MNSYREIANVIGARVLTASIQAATFVLLARALAPDSFGVLMGGWAIFLVVTGVSDIGLSSHAVRNFGGAKNNLAKAAVRIQSVLTFSAAVVLTGVAGALVLAFSFPSALLALGPMAWLEKQAGVRMACAVALRKGRKQLVAAALLRAPPAVLTAAAVWLGYDALIAFVVGSMLAGSVAVYYLRVGAPLRGLSRRVAVPLIRASVPFWLASMNAQVRNLETFIVGVTAGATQAGVYALPSRVAGPIRLFASSISLMALPYAARKDSEMLRKLSTLVWVGAGLLLMSLMLIAPVADEAIVALVGTEYADSAPVLMILLLGVVPNLPANFYSARLQGSGREILVAKMGVFWTVVAISGVVVASIAYGARGAAVVNVTVNSLSLLVVLALTYRKCSTTPK